MSTTIVHFKISLVKYSFKKVFLYFVKNRSVAVRVTRVQGHVAAARYFDDGGIHTAFEQGHRYQMTVTLSK